MSIKREFYDFGIPIEGFWNFGPYKSIMEEATKDIHRVTRRKRYRRYTLRSVSFVQRGPYTFAEVVLHHPRGYNTPVGVGFSKQRPTDVYNPTTGKFTAMKRAIEDAVNG